VASIEASPTVAQCTYSEKLLYTAWFSPTAERTEQLRLLWFLSCSLRGKLRGTY